LKFLQIRLFTPLYCIRCLKHIFEFSPYLVSFMAGREFFQQYANYKGYSDKQCNGGPSR
jgi:hypothetical protein